MKYYTLVVQHNPELDNTTTLYCSATQHPNHNKKLDNTTPLHCSATPSLKGNTATSHCSATKPLQHNPKLQNVYHFTALQHTNSTQPWTSQCCPTSLLCNTPFQHNHNLHNRAKHSCSTPHCSEKIHCSETSHWHCSERSHSNRSLNWTLLSGRWRLNIYLLNIENFESLESTFMEFFWL